MMERLDIFEIKFWIDTKMGEDVYSIDLCEYNIDVITSIIDNYGRYLGFDYNTKTKQCWVKLQFKNIRNSVRIRYRSEVEYKQMLRDDKINKILGC